VADGALFHKAGFQDNIPFVSCYSDETLTDFVHYFATGANAGDLGALQYAPKHRKLIVNGPVRNVYTTSADGQNTIISVSSLEENTVKHKLHISN
jgi:hypothetical protein